MKNQLHILSILTCLFLCNIISCAPKLGCGSSKEDSRKAISYLTKKLQKNPNDGELIYHLAMAYYTLSDWENTLKTWDQLIEIHPKFNGAHANRGITKYFLKDLEGACEDYKISIALGNDPSIIDGKPLSDYVTKYAVALLSSYYQHTSNAFHFENLSV